MHYVDANLYHNLITRRSVTGILYLANKTPIDWYSKKQVTVETPTYRSEFIAACICVDQSIDLKNTLHYLGVPVCKKVTTSQWLTVLQSHMPSSTSNTMHCLSIKLGKPLLLPSLGSIILMVRIILPTSSASIGDTGRSGSYSKLCSFGGETPRTLMCLIFTRYVLVLLQISNKSRVTRTTQEWPATLCALLVLFSSFRDHD